MSLSKDEAVREDPFLAARCDSTKWRRDLAIAPNKKPGATITFANASDFHHDIAETLERDDDNHFAVRRSIASRYCKVTSLYVRGDECMSYAYYTEGTQPPKLGAHKSVTLSDIQTKIIPESAESAYKSMDFASKDKLYIILAAPKKIWKKIILEFEGEKTWNYRLQEPCGAELHSQIYHYGTSDETDLLDTLVHGRTKEKFQADLLSISEKSLGYHSLGSLWIEALTCGMRNGSGRAAVRCLIDVIAGLIPALKENVQKLAIMNITAPYAGDAFSITTSSSSKRKTRGSIEPPSKKSKREDDECDSESESSVPGLTHVKVFWPKCNRQFADMSVLAYDADTDLDHTADVQLHAWGEDLQEAFEQVGMAMFGYMTEIDTVEMKEAQSIEAEGDDMMSLLFHFLDEFLFLFCAEPFFIARKIKITEFDKENFRIKAVGYGEEFDLKKHPQGTEVKAITYSNMQIYDNDKHEVFVIIDI